MKRIVLILAAVLGMAAFAPPVAASDFRAAVQRVVVRNRAPVVQRVQVQRVEVQKVQKVVQVQQVQRVQQVVQKVVAQPVYAAVVQPVQAYYAVPAAFTAGYGASEALRREVEELRLRVQAQELRQRLADPPK